VAAGEREAPGADAVTRNIASSGIYGVSAEAGHFCPARVLVKAPAMSTGQDQDPAQSEKLLETLLDTDLELLREKLADTHPEDVADLIRNVGKDRAAQLLEHLPPEYAAQVFERLGQDQQGQIAGRIDLEPLTQLTLEMSADDRVDFLSLVPEPVSKSLLRRIEEEDPEILEEVEELTRWPETSAGGLMTTDYISISARLTIRDAIEAVRRRAGDAEGIDALFVTGPDNKLNGVLSMRRMLLSEPGENIDAVMNHNVISVPPLLDQEDVARKLAKYDLNVLPVVSDRGRILGVITADDVLDVLTDEQSEDVQKMGAIEPLREDYFSTSFRVLLRKRAPWLCILFVGGLLTTHTLQAYEGALSAMTQLSFYLPLLISAGGNSGAQSSTLMIRGLAVGNVRSADWARVLRRETLQGLILGTMLAVVGVSRAILEGGNPAFSALIGLTIVCIVVLGCIAGAMTPLALHRVKVDPATSSTPFISTMVDVLGIIIYLTLAQLLLGAALSKPTP
jgi:magnesium transporter